MTKHEELLEIAKEAINQVFSDKSADNDTRRESLRELQEDVIMFLDAIPD